MTVEGAECGFEAAEGGGHFMFIENPEKFNRRVLQFLSPSLEGHSIPAAFLLPNLQRPNLTTTGALVSRLLFKGTRTVGAAFLKRKTIKLRFNSNNLTGLHWAIAEE